MKWLRTIIVFDKGEVIQDPDWKDFHESYRSAIENMVHPVGSDKMIVRKRVKNGTTGKYRRNGVQFLKKTFFKLIREEGWVAESQVGVERVSLEAKLKTYPDCKPYIEEISSQFGGFDFFTHSDDRKVAIEWETGNISSSHRSLNKLCIALNAGTIDIGVLIVPSRALYTHLTDRIGNIGELSPYLSMWNEWGDYVVHEGLLAITVVEHDELTEEESVPFFNTGTDGRHKEGQQSLAARK